MLACSSDPAASPLPESVGTTDAAPIDNPDDPPAVDGSTSTRAAGKDATSQDAAPVPQKIVVPKPPVGSTMCKSGTFTAAEASGACSAGNNGFGCNGVSTSGGRYEMWRTPAGPGVAKPLRWIWVRFDDVQSTGTLGASCGLGSSFNVRGYYSTTDAADKRGFGPTSLGASDPGEELSRGSVDDLPGNQAAVFNSFVDDYTKIRLSRDADCPKLGQVAIRPLRMEFTF